MARLNLIAWDNGVGLSSDLRLLQRTLAGNGNEVSVTRLGRGGLRKILRPWGIRLRIAVQRMRGRHLPSYDINLFLEHARTEYFPLACHNVLIPNPEWFDAKDEAALPQLDCLLVKTRHADAIFRTRGCAVRYIGFTSPDRYDPSIARERAFFHLAGRSEHKNTEPLLELWRKHPEWPRLTVVQNPRTARPGPPTANIEHRVDYLGGAELKRLQNAHRFHLCPSQTEGYGHYLVEAMSVGAVTISVDAPPMNELITAERGVLIGYSRTGTQNLATTYFFDDEAMVAAIERLIAMPDAQVEKLSQAARAWYESNHAALAPNLQRAIHAIG